MPVLSVEHLSVKANYKEGTREIISDISFSVETGERLAIVGESGCGKTMTALAIFGILPDNCEALGDILLDGENLLALSEKEMNQRRGNSLVLIPQSGADFLNPVLKVRYQIAETLKRAGIQKKQALKKESAALLHRVGFQDPEEVLNKYPFQLSGGMAQRVILAIGLALAPKLVIADEPTRGIDDETSSLYLAQLRDFFSDSAVIMITHNISVAENCQKLLVMYAGEWMEYGDTQTILKTPVHPYTQSLIRALPDNGFTLSASFQQADRSHPDRGCPFYGRCPSAPELCQNNKPPVTVKNGIYRRCIHA